MPENSVSLGELLKYPVIAGSIVLAVVGLKSCVGIKFGALTEIGPSGAKFAEESQATLTAISDLEARLNETQVRLAAVEGRATTPPSGETNVEADSAAQLVSDATARIARIRTQAEPERATGYIWIGNYSVRWQPTQLAKIDTGQPIDLHPNQILPGTQYKVLGNMVLRDGLPRNDADYFRARASLGVVPAGYTVAVADQPVGITRGSRTQYWAKVTVVATGALR